MGAVIKLKYVIVIAITCVCQVMKVTAAVRHERRVDNSDNTDRTSHDESKKATSSDIETDKAKIETPSSENQNTGTSSTQTSTLASTSTNQDSSGSSLQMKPTGKSSIRPVAGLIYSGHDEDFKNGMANDSGSRFVKDCGSRDQASTSSGSRFQEPSASYVIDGNNTSAEYVETEVVNFKKITKINPDENLIVAECTKGQYAPRTMKMYESDLFQCNSVCISGCEMGYGLYSQNPNVVPPDENEVTCYLIKVQANYKIKRFQKVSRKGKLKDVNECHCGSYFGPGKFQYCKNVNQNYASPRLHPLILKHKEDGQQRSACMYFCNRVTSFITLKGGKPALADCWPHHVEQTEIVWQTFTAHGQCVRRNGDTKCICGIPRFHKPTWNWEETLKRPNKKFRYVLNTSASVREQDDRIYDFARLIYAPQFFIPINKNLGDGYKSSSDQRLTNYKKTKPSITLTTSDMSEGEKEFVRKKGSVETIHNIRSIPPRDMRRSYNGRGRRVHKDKDSVNPLAFKHSWISDSDSERDSEYTVETTTAESNSKAVAMESNTKTTTAESNSKAATMESNTKTTITAESNSKAATTESNTKTTAAESKLKATEEPNTKTPTTEHHSKAKTTEPNTKTTTESKHKSNPKLKKEKNLKKK